MKKLIDNLDFKKVGILLGVFLLITALWGTPLVTPLKILVVLLHEISHGLAAIFTGGSIESIEVNMNQGGVCYTLGGSRFLTLTAGYLGSMLWGAIILVAASRTKVDRWLSIALGVFLIAIAAFYIRNVFGLVFAVGFGIAMVGAGWKLNHDWNELLLQVIGLTSCQYAILDILSDVIYRPGIGSDADMLAEISMIPGVVWGVIWIALAAVVSAIALVIAAQNDAKFASK